MKTLVLYDSAYGNTAAVAKAIAYAANQSGEAGSALIADVTEMDLKDADYLIVGSPTRGGRPTKNLQKFLSDLPNSYLNGCRAAAFDTKFDIKQQKFGLRVLMGTIGYAAPKIAATLKSKGASLIADPEGFIVEDMKGPLKSGERERSVKWINSILS